MSKEWKTGVADEDWKVAICTRDIEMVARTIATIEYVMGGMIDTFTGAEIRQALMVYAESAKKSIVIALDRDDAATLEMRLRQIKGA
ncbi:hypothetical protein [Rhizobium sp. Root1220]|uniref:hypothetical protein n=1 Tax=Rhizobium sp. Root1220 TaxID=1736432 RepID=UPI0006FE2AB9|nr:hypothetical protein [Rhizobium sp. Root1220]KQV83251.1 hypothetical protein ASC90_21910 [Rhizobium sp. Root1220]